MFKQSSADELGPAPRLRPARSRHSNPGLFCANCGYAITTESEKIEVQGSHQHVCTNPEQITFRIGCFSHAAGCRQIGPVTAEHSWFAGHRWQVSLCHRCGIHLGWRFTGTGAAFYGLILMRLISRKDD